MSHRAVIHDQDVIRSAFRDWSNAYQEMTSRDLFRVTVDLVFDWSSIAVAMVLLHRFGWWSCPATIVWVGNRQRALGNLLHDAAHRNLARSTRINDAIARLFIAPALFNSLAVYREQHARHHAWLGDSNADPDFIAVHQQQGHTWRRPFRTLLLTPAAWSSSAFGHLHQPKISWSRRTGIAGWWTVLLCVTALALGLHAATLFFGVWMLARATVFHAITTFRELCDHFGRRPSGIFNYTRDVCSHGIWRWIIHPHNNGYHLTHHLMPSVPYHRLANAQRQLLQLPTFSRAARVCNSYFRGPDAVVREWEHSIGEQR
ncbi:fatty acid desaturase [Trinickia symbiotica]|uniref:Fatty acid desaturase n=1 Tax=Trinickia symbiotica TaxID=863227 RepID=A0A2T3XKN8_9BURK|nr:fatty acid desaturase [Trinickia symbiotica]PTB16989.1 fatty acid desaturase [Trinickia symbiotica]